MKNFDLEHKLEQFKKEHILFDKSGKKYTSIAIHISEIEKMFKLIGELEKEILKLEIPTPIEEYLKNRIKELKEADAIACRNRWDMEKSANERGIWREQSNEITARRHELEEVLKQMGRI